MCGMQGGDKPKTGWLNKAVALTAAVLTGDNEMAMSLADEYAKSASMAPLLEAYIKQQTR